MGPKLETAASMLLFTIVLTFLWTPAAAFDRQPIKWIWTGAVTSDSAVVTVRLNHAETAVAAKAKSDNAMDIVVGKQDNDTLPGYVRFVFKPLVPNLSYKATFSTRVRDERGIVSWTTQPQVATFRTPPEAGSPYNFTFLAGSCADNNSDSSIFSVMQQESPLFFMHTGDLHYGNVNRDDESAYLDLLDTVFASPRQSRLYASTPMIYMWDDHDFGPNNSDGETPGRNAAVHMYTHVVPHYPLAGYQGDEWRALDRLPSVHYRFTMGRVRFIVTDLRSGRVTNQRVLSARQYAWFEHELTLASREVESGALASVVWISTMPWVSDRVKWGAYEQQRSIARLVEELPALSGRLFMVAGDAHMLGFDDGSHSPGGIPVFHAAALDAKPTSKGGPYSHGIFPGRGQYGRIEVVDFGRDKPACVVFQGYRVLNGPFEWTWANRLWNSLRRQLDSTYTEAVPVRKRLLLEYNTCHPERAFPQQLYEPSPRWVEKSWKKTKRVLELSKLTDWVLPVVDENTFSAMMVAPPYWLFLLSPAMLFVSSRHMFLKVLLVFDVYIAWHSDGQGMVSLCLFNFLILQWQPVLQLVGMLFVAIVAGSYLPSIVSCAGATILSIYLVYPRQCRSISSSDGK